MMIIVVYKSCDGFRERRKFKTLLGASKFARKMVGDYPEIGSRYAISGDGVGKVVVEGCPLDALFN